MLHYGRFVRRKYIVHTKRLSVTQSKYVSIFQSTDFYRQMFFITVGRDIFIGTLANNELVYNV